VVVVVGWLKVLTIKTGFVFLFPLFLSFSLFFSLSLSFSLFLSLSLSLFPSRHLLIQLGRQSTLVREHYLEHQDTVFHWWENWLNFNTDSRNTTCDRSNRPFPDWFKEMKSNKPIYIYPKHDELLKTVKAIVNGGNDGMDYIFADGGECLLLQPLFLHSSTTFSHLHCFY